MKSDKSDIRKGLLMAEECSVAVFCIAKSASTPKESGKPVANCDQRLPSQLIKHYTNIRIFGNLVDT
jgi:hypothetical protein